MTRNTSQKRTFLGQQRPLNTARNNFFIVGLALIMLSAGFFFLFASIPEDSATTFHAPPKLDTTYDNITSEQDTTLTGQDVDNNGIRDDVQTDIAISYPVAQQKRVLDMARAFQEFLISAQNTSGSGRPSVVDKAALYLAAKTCVHDAFGFKTMVDAGQLIVSDTVNNDLRMKAYEKAESTLSGAAFDDTSTKCMSKS
jgi:hypothetical protein